MDLGVVYKGNSTILLAVGQKGETSLADFTCRMRAFKPSSSVAVVDRVITDKNSTNDKFVARLSSLEVDGFDVDAQNKIIIRIERVSNNPVQQAYKKDAVFYFKLIDNGYGA